VAGVLFLLPHARPAHLHGPQLAILVAASMATSLWDESFLLGCGRLRALSLRIATGGWVYAVVVAITWAGPGLTITSAAVAWTVSQALVALFLHAGPVRELGLPRPDLRLLRTMVRFGARAWVGTLSNKLNARLDQIVMGFIATEAALGIYAIAVNGAELLLYVPSAIAAALLPTIAREAGDRAGERTLRVFRSASLVALVTLVVAAAAGPTLLPLAFGHAFRPSVRPFLWLLPGVLGYAAMSIFTSALLAMSSPGLSSFGPLSAALSGLALDLALIPRFGASGAAAAATGAFVIGGVTALVLFRRRSPFPWRHLLPRPDDVGALVRLPGQLLAR
jgi:O-antigen/teichoic acid export membrane protein